jgi:hypothetical protein
MMEVFIQYGYTVHTFNFIYSSDTSQSIPGVKMLKTMGDLRQKATADLNFEQSVMLTDRFDNILLDSVDILQALYAFYQFQVVDHYPVIKAILPYGWDNVKYVSQGNAMEQEFLNENIGLVRMYEEKIEIIKARCKTKTADAEEEVKTETAENLGKKLFFFLKKTGRMIYMMTIIAAYWIVFVPRMKVQDSLKFLNSIQIIEKQIADSMIANQTYDFRSFSNYYFSGISNSDAITQNALLTKIAFYQKRYDPVNCTTFSGTTKSFIKANKDKFKCYEFATESIATYGDGSEGFVHKQVPGVSYSREGKDYTTENGYYLYLDTANLTATQQQINTVLDKGWVDSYTKYVGIVLNMYQPNFQLLLTVTAVYDFRFGFDILVI